MPLLVALAVAVDGRRDAAQRHVVIERHVVADFRRFADDHTHAVVHEEPLADARRGMDFDTRQEAAGMRNHTPEHAPAAPPKPARQTVRGNGVKAWITENNFDRGPRRGIARLNASNFFADCIEHYAPCLCYKQSLN